MSLGGYAQGLLVESNNGRPTKIGGNPLHLASLGATDVFAQASILDLWDPSRLQMPRVLGQPRITTGAKSGWDCRPPRRYWERV